MTSDRAGKNLSREEYDGEEGRGPCGEEGYGYFKCQLDLGRAGNLQGALSRKNSPDSYLSTMALGSGFAIFN